ncbi:MAG: hypothetical protein WDO19_23955 [Bacteroidota bacterium]
MEQLKIILAGKKNIHKRIGILFSMEDKNKEFIAILLLFKKGKFKKFKKEANKLVTKNYSGENILVREFNYSKYSKEFILAKIRNKLSLISVPSLPQHP